ncbi:MAG: 23S rRNA (pseudouridine(1915)-N(3))-methyltransferase RlmH [Bauldia sp.]
MTRLLVAAVGRLKADGERVLADRYLDRAGKAGGQLGFTLALRETAESRAARDLDRKREESAALLAAVPAGAILVALDERGSAIRSEDFATRLGAWRDEGHADIVFLIGGADGLDPDLVSTARLKLALGAMTWPHQLVRVMVLEQIYRAFTILAGHPYHRGG